MFNLIKSLNKDQKKALEILNSKSNVFLTGVAGSGKSHLVNHFLNALNEGGVNRSDTVSYTHLDVYKRQQLHRIVLVLRHV